MPLNIKDPEADRLVREVAGLSDELLAIGRRCAALPVKDSRSPEEILGYDESGLPGSP